MRQLKGLEDPVGGTAPTQGENSREGAGVEETEGAGFRWAEFVVLAGH